jgi:hypothetical protein
LTLALSGIYHSILGIAIDDSQFAQHLKYGSRRIAFYNIIVEYLLLANGSKEQIVSVLGFKKCAKR